MTMHGWSAKTWESPVFMSWAAMGIRLAGVLLVWPLALRGFNSIEVILWQVFSTVLAMQGLADFGLSPVLSRLAASRGGAIPGYHPPEGEGAATYLRRLTRVGEWMQRRVLCIAALLLAVVTGIMFGRLIAQASLDGGRVWLAWGCVVATFLIGLQAVMRGAILQGAGHLVEVRRVEAITGLIGVLVTAGGLYWSGGLWVVSSVMLGVSLVQARWFRRMLKRENAVGIDGPDEDWRVLLPVVWRGAWRSGVGSICTAGVGQCASLLVAGLAGTSEAAAYLIGWRLLGIVSQFSQVPFYSRLPEFGMLAAAGKNEALLARAGRSMAVALGLFVLCALTMGYVGGLLLEVLRAGVAWPSQGLWMIMVVAVFIERYGAMHLQLDTLGHAVRWHVTAGGYAIISVSVMFGLADGIGAWAVPLGMMAGHVCFYCPYAVCLSKRRYSWTWRQFDWPATVWLGVLVVGCIFRML